MEFLLPLVAYAQAPATGVKAVIFRINDYVINPLIRLGFIVVLIIFIWGVVDYIRDRNSGFIFDKEGKKSGEGASRIVWGLIGLFIMVSVFGIMRLMVTLTGSTIQTP